MMVDMRNIKNNELVSLDILDIDMRLSIVGEPDAYKVKVCRDYVLDRSFKTKMKQKNSLRHCRLLEIIWKMN